MYITSITTSRLKNPLKKPFKTALRTLHEAEAVLIRLETDTGLTGVGEAPPTAAITGETLESIEAAVTTVIGPALQGLHLHDKESVFQQLHRSIIGNTSAKAAVDMAIHDVLARKSGLPLYQYLGGWTNELETDYTVSVNEPAEMAEDAALFRRSGFRILKLKVGTDTIEKDLQRVQAVADAAGEGVLLRLDANQGWKPKEAIEAIQEMSERGLPVELIEQPVHRQDLNGLKQVTDAVSIPVMADESVFSLEDARRVLEGRCADMINIKLMKAGGIYMAQKICTLADAYRVPCMVGSMIESRLGISAAAHFAGSSRAITHYDFDAPLLMKEDKWTGGLRYEGAAMHLQQEPGLGIHPVPAEKGVPNA
ncbi:dipeptide epimerase [Alkalicoccus luteus]|uniref:dipeptide epimerase n=1 Tax=Alkalicoccus luteus TaxID=1237094 RepID=UPI004033E00C